MARFFLKKLHSTYVAILFCSICYATKQTSDDEKNIPIEARFSFEQYRGLKIIDDDTTILFTHIINALVPSMDQTYLIPNYNETIYLEKYVPVIFCSNCDLELVDKMQSDKSKTYN